MTMTDRYHQIAEQDAYALRIATFGLHALLAPYTVRPVRLYVPAQDHERACAEPLPQTS
jgi:hypothetical protein